MSAVEPNSQTFRNLQPYLFAVAYRMTGSASDAEDLVQDAWIRYLDAGSPSVESLRAWLTTTVSRLALDYLKSARVQREQYRGSWIPEPVRTRDAAPGPAETIEQREEISLAFLTLLEQLTPEQRVVYVLREGFELPYDEIGLHVDKSATACRQIYRRARNRLGDARRPSIAPPQDHQHLIEQFLAAFSAGNVSGIANLLAQDVVWVGDGGPNRLAQRRPVIGADKVSRGLAGLINKITPEMRITVTFADLNGAPAIVMYDRGEIDRVFAIDIASGRITTVRAILNLEKLRHLGHSLDSGNENKARHQ